MPKGGGSSEREGRGVKMGGGKGRGIRRVVEGEERNKGRKMKKKE